MRILLVEDNRKMGRFIKKCLEQNSYAVDHTESGTTAESLVAENAYDLIILDVMLIDQNGMDTARHLRTDGYNGPILMLTALSGTKDKVHGLDSGADDYLTKPFETEELLARVRALIRRNQQNPGVTSQLKFSDLEMDLVSRRVKRGSREILLTSKEFALLEYFMRNPDRPLSRSLISEHVWETRFEGDSNVIDVYVNTVRKKIDHTEATKLIHTVVGVGYALREA